MSIDEKTRTGGCLSEDGEWIPDGWQFEELSGHFQVKHGFAFKGEFIGTKGAFVLVTPGSFHEVGGFKDVPQKRKCYSEQPDPAYVLNRGDLVVAMTEQGPGLLGSSALIPANNLFLHNQRIGLLHSYSADISKRFLYYLFNHKRFRAEISATASGTKIRHTSPDRIRNVKLPLPPHNEQREIASILGCLDDKIELLREQNETLEALAQTLFKRWFIDFNFPDEDGNPYKDSGGKMQPSEFGEIPKSWEVGSISLFADHIKNSVSPDKSPETLYRHYSIPSFDDGMEPVAERGSEIKSNKYEVVATSILVSKLNPSTPRIWQIQDVEEDSVCSTEFQVVRPQNGFFGFVYGALMSSPVRRELTGRAHGTSSSHQRVSPADIFEVPFPISSDRTLEEAFSQTSHGLLTKAVENRAQIQTLTQLRDTLLPKLMKGEIRVPYAAH